MLRSTARTAAEACPIAEPYRSIPLSPLLYSSRFSSIRLGDLLYSRIGPDVAHLPIAAGKVMVVVVVVVMILWLVVVVVVGLLRVGWWL